MTTASFVPETVRLDLYAGDGAALQLTVTDAGGAPLALTGTVSAQIRAARTDLTPEQTFAVTVAANVATVSLTGAQTSSLGQFGGYWDVQWAPSGGQPVTIVQGPVRCGLDVTR